jgi:sugar O-acyltransferase (sialic acid O-acetyltransferase NeuD family)
VKLLIVGAGGHGRVVADIAASDAGWTEIAFLDDAVPVSQKSGAWPVVGAFAEIASLAKQFDACVAALGDARLRLEHLAQAKAAGFRVPTLVHPSAVVSEKAQLAEGVVVCAAAVVNIGASIARGCIVNTGATVDHDCRLEEGVHICPGAHLAGNVTIGARSWFGIGAVAKQGIRIGSDVTVGAGAVCLENVKDGVTVVGVPARPVPPE